MSTTRILNLGLIVLFVMLLLLGAGALIYTHNLEKFTSQHEAIIIGQEAFLPGEQAALRVVVRDSASADPLPNAEIRVLLMPQDFGQVVELYRGQTNTTGTANIAFRVPSWAGGNQTLRIETASSLGSDWVERPVRIERPVRLLLNTDKPIYQPGQMIHLRALALDDFSHQAAAGQELEFSVADGKGNKVFRQVKTTSEFGIASADFQLASEVNLGNYKITAALGDVTSEKTVEVKLYQLPKFAITLQPEKPFYLPGQHVRVSLHAAYFYGKPVAQGQVMLSGYTFDVDRQDVFVQQGLTDDAGNYTFEFDMPDFLAGTELENGLGRFYLEASVIDQAAHEENNSLSLPVAQQPLIIEAIPESGILHPRVDNIIYVLVSTPDGAPAEAEVSAAMGEIVAQPVHTGPGGLAEIHLTPSLNFTTLSISARSPAGDISQLTLTPGMGSADYAVLLRPDKPAYTVGEPMSLSILTSGKNRSAYLDIVKGNQTLSTRVVDLQDHHAEIVIDLTPDMAGTLTLHAYSLLPDGNYSRDTRLVVVNDAQALSIDLQPSCAPDRLADGLCVFHPGESVGLDVRVQDAQGSGVRAALGLSIVDESLFAVATQDPGFECLYFLLEEGLLQPKYDIHGYSVPELVSGELAYSAAPEAAVRGAAFASLAALLPDEPGFGMHVNSHQEVLQRVNVQKKEQFILLGAVFSYGSGLVALIAVIVSSVALWQRGRFWTGVGMSLLSWIALAIYLWVAISLAIALGVRNSESTLGLILGILGLAFLIGLVRLVVVAIREKNTLLGWSVGLAGMYAALVGALLVTANWLRDTDIILVAVFSLLAMFTVYMGTIFAAGVFKPTRSTLLVTLLLVGSIFLSNCSAALPMVGMMESEMAKDFAPEPESASESATTAQADAPRLRQYFPETLLWIPETVTGEDGRLKLDFAAADSITTWRMTAFANTVEGQLGSTTAPLRVFQDFFIDLDLPQALTVGDELSVPVGVFNYLDATQTVRLEVAPADWFELLDEPVKQINVEANEITVVYFRIQALDFGLQPFQVTAYGSHLSDAILKYVQVYPNGRQLTFSQSDFLTPGDPASMPVRFPSGTITGTQTLLVKIYPGVLAQVVEGLESLLRMPNGCFEQTTSATYPNVLVLDYLQSTGQISPEVQFTAEGYINQGYQRLVTFEVGSTGGFSLFGEAPADRMLTAYGLQEFADMSRVFPVDPAISDRAAAWLFEQQSSDGSWANDRGLVHEGSWSGLRDNRLPVTAYITWSLISAGYAQSPGTQRALEYLEIHQSAAEQPYVLALVANALVDASRASLGASLSPTAEAVLARLAEASLHQDGGIYWISGVASYMGGSGAPADIETSALAVLALMRSGRYPDLADGALKYLVRAKDDYGTWHSTLATVTALKALLESTRSGSELTDAEVTILLDGAPAAQVRVNRENFDVVQLVSLADLPLDQVSSLELRMLGEGSLAYQVSGAYYLPWALASAGEAPSLPEAADLRVQYDRSELAVGETVRVDVRFAPIDPAATIASAMVEIGLPPGFSVVTEDLEALVTAGMEIPSDSPLPVIERYELAGRKLLVYVSNVSAEYPLAFSFRERARFPLRAQTTASSGYNYYDPAVSAEEAPVVLEVK